MAPKTKAKRKTIGKGATSSKVHPHDSNKAKRIQELKHDIALHKRILNDSTLSMSARKDVLYRIQRLMLELAYLQH